MYLRGKEQSEELAKAANRSLSYFSTSHNKEESSGGIPKGGGEWGERCGQGLGQSGGGPDVSQDGGDGGAGAPQGAR